MADSSSTKILESELEQGTYFTPTATPPVIVRQPQISSASTTEYATAVSSTTTSNNKRVRLPDHIAPDTAVTIVDMPAPGGTPLIADEAAATIITTNPTATVPKVAFMSQKSYASQCGLSLYDEDTSTMPTLAAYLRSFTIPGPTDQDEHGQTGGNAKAKKTKLGTLLGVYLPTIQHILGVQMFLRLVWIVGVGGVVESFAMVFICCLCTFLTSISISAIATNGIIDSGGAYFMISRNLGAEFGGAVGVLYYLANAVATAMYLVGGVEILIMYIAPDLPQFGDPHHHNEADLFNNFRVYATGLLLIEFVIVAMGVKFVQFFAPISLACVVVSILSVYAGAFAANPETSPMLCMLGDRLLKPNAYTWPNGTIACDKSVDGPLWNSYCNVSSDPFNDALEYGCADEYFAANNISYVPGIPGFFGGIIKENLWSTYLQYNESAPGQEGNGRYEVTQDIGTTFFIILAIFFPSVTGIFTGANMSGDLKDAQKSLPIGTIAAQLTTSFVYLSFVLVFGGTIHGALLRDKYGDSLNRGMVVAKLAWPNEWVLLVGSFTSTFGAALQCLCSAPRLLQSIAKDDVIPILRPFSVITKRSEPLRALLISTFIAEIAVLIGGIDYIAPVVDFFFLMCYCFVNLVCALQTLLNAPNWRPRFRFYHWSLSLLGAILCLFIMFATFWYFALIVLALCASIYKYIEYKGAKKEWGDGIRGLALSTAQYSLLRVEESHMHPKNWRPQLLVLVKLNDSEQEANAKLLQLAGQLKAGQGLTIVATMLEGDTRAQHDRERAELDREKLKHLMREQKVKGFAHVVVCQHAAENVGTLIQCVGIGGLRPNTVMVNWPTHWRESLAKRDEEHLNFVDAIHRAAAMDICLLVPKGIVDFPEYSDRLCGTVDVWWVMHDGGLLILLPFLLKQHKIWRQCKLRVFAVAQLHDNSIKMKQDLQKWVYQLRIDAVVEVVEFADSTISAYTYERTLMMEERSKLALDYKLSRVEMDHEPQLVVDRSRSHMNLRGLDLNTPRHSGAHPVALADGHNSLSVPHTAALATASAIPTAKRVGFKLSFAKSPKVSRTYEIQPVLDNSTVGEKSPLADSPSVDERDEDEEQRKRASFHIAPRKGHVGGQRKDEHQIADDFSNISEPPSPTTTSSAADHGGSTEPSVFTFSPRDWQQEFDSQNLLDADRIDEDDPFSAGPYETPAAAQSTKKATPKFVIGGPVAPSTPAPLVVIEPEQTPKASASATTVANGGIAPDSSTKSMDPKFANLDRKKVRKMHSAVKFNRAIQEKSADSQLVVINLPRPPRARIGLGNYMDYLEALTDGLSRVLLVRGTGREVITIYS